MKIARALVLSRILKSEQKALSFVSSLFSSEEGPILKANKVLVGLQPIREERMAMGARAMIGPGDYWQFQAYLKTLRESEVSRRYEGIGEFEYGDIADIAGRNVLAQSLTLMNKELILSYKKLVLSLKKGLRRKNLVIVIPLKYAILVQQKKRPKHLEIRFELPRKEGDIVLFDLWVMRLTDYQAWLDKLNQLIEEQMKSDKLPSSN
jgi:hypothetical protein